MKQDYMSRLRRAARRMLLPEDAAEVIADYAELSAGRSDEELEREVGNPVGAVRRVADEKEYHAWTRLFTVLSVCVLAIPLTLRVSVGRLPVEFWPGDGRTLCWVVGLALTLRYRWKTRKSATAGAALKTLAFPLLALILAVAALSLWQKNLFAALMSVSDVSPYYGQFRAMIAGFQILAFACGAVGVFALIEVRISGRRWLSLFILALTAEVVCMNLFLFSTGLNIDATETTWRALLDCQASAVKIFAIGIAAAGWALC